MTTIEQSLSGLTVLDLGAGMAAGLVAKFLAEAGARVLRLEPQRGDPFYEVYPAYGTWHAGAAIEYVENLSDARVSALLAQADVCICGGEDYPGLDWRADTAAAMARHPDLVLLELTGYPEGHAAPGPASEILLQAASGLAYEHYSESPLCWAIPVASQGTALQALAGVLAAVYAQRGGGAGQRVSVSMYEGALTWAVGYWHEASAPTRAFDVLIPKDPYPLIFRCRDDKHIQFVLGSAGSKSRLYRVLEIDDPTVGPNDSGLPSMAGGPKKFWGDVDLLAEYVVRHDSGPLLEKLWEADIPAERVLAPGVVWDDPQVSHNRAIATAQDGTRSVRFPLRGEAGSGTEGAARLTASPFNTQAPLEGLRVLDFGVFLAGPFASVPLSDLGADVIKVEPLLRDPFRNIYRPFASVNRGKRAIAIDMKTPEGREIVNKLFATAGVVLNNFRPGVSGRLGLDAAGVHAVNPNAIVVETTGYGQDGPKAQRAGLDMIFQALCGHEIRGGGEGNPPLWYRAPIVDYACGLLASIGSLLSLLLTQRGGGGGNVQSDLLGAGLFLMSDLVQRPDGRFVGAPTLNRAQTGLHPAESFYETQDGWIAIAARGDAMARRMALALALGQIAEVKPTNWGTAEAAAVAAACRRHSSDALIDLLKKADVWVAPCVRDGERVLRDPALQGLVFRGKNAQFGDIRQIGPLFRMSAAKPPVQRVVPEHGEHTRAVLVELGYDAGRIDELYARHIVA